MAASAFKKLESVNELHESVHDQQTLLSKLNKELSAYTVFDLMKIQVQLEKECKYLPPKYKKVYREKMAEQLISNFKEILAKTHSCNQILDKEQFIEFMESFQEILDNIDTKDTSQAHDMTVMYHLCALYNIFITQTPPHPEGTPFPGGFFVEKIGDDYYCPVKDKQKDNDEALCRFCVARQTQME